MTPTPETTLAAYVVEMLIGEQYKVYQEVAMPIMGQEYPIDIVGILEDRVICVEVKRNLNDKVIEQAERNKYFCNQSWIAVPEPKHISNRHRALRTIAMGYGIGVMYISPSGIISKPVNANEHDRLDERLIDDCLCERQTTGCAAGTAAGKRSKKDEWEEARELLKANPNLTLKEIASELDWPTPKRNSFGTKAHGRRIPGIRPNKCHPATYYYSESAA